MANTWTKIATQTIGANNASTVYFTSIPQNFTDLVLKVSYRTTAASTNYSQLVLYANANYYPAANSSFTELTGNSSSTYSGRDQGHYVRIAYTSASTAGANIFGSCNVYIPNYSSSTLYKTIISEGLSENNAVGANSVFHGIWSGLIRDTTPISQIAIDTGVGSAQYTEVTLYGI
jgi:hypothetical protein